MPTTVPRSILEGSEGLNVGSGPHYARGWTNIDVHAYPGTTPPDFLLDVFEMDEVFPDRVFEKAYLGHVLEHVAWEEIPQFLGIIQRKLVEGGTIMAVGPCIHRAIETRQPRSLIEAILADPRNAHEPGAHAWTPTSALTVEAMTLGGLEGVRETPIEGVRGPGWPNVSTASWQVAVFGFAR